MIVEAAQRLNNTKEYYFSIKLREIEQLKSEGKDIINMAIGSPDMAPSDNTVQALITHAQDPCMHGYPPYRGLPELRQAIARWCQQTYHIELDQETEILPLIGSKEGITHISLAFLDEGDEVLVPEIGYPAYRAVTQMLGGKAVPYPMTESQYWQPDFDQLGKTDLSRVKLMWLNYPHMPTGTPPSKALFEKFIEFAHRHKILLCHDNPYSLVLNNDDPLSLLSIPGAKEVAVELNSFSKSHNMAGWRIGWVAGHRDYLDAIIKIKTNVDTGMFKPLQLAAAEALNNPSSWHADRNQTYLARRKVVEQILDKLHCRFDTQQVGMFMWARLPEGHDAKTFIDHLLYQHHVFISPGFIFGPKGAQYIRASLCMDEATLKQVLKRLENFDPSAI